jgi:LPS-assembly protein
VLNRNFYIFCIVMFAAILPCASEAQLLTGYRAQEIVEPAPLPVVDVLPQTIEPKQQPQEQVKAQTQIQTPVIDSAPEDAVDFQADDLTHDDKNNIVTATGNVVLKQAGKELRAEKIVYNLNTDLAVATGNVVLLDINGDRHYAESVQLQNQMKDGLVHGLKTFMQDGSRFIAKSGQRSNGSTTTMDDAAYTPCRVCGDDETPSWEIKASEIVHDRENQRISYKNARFEFLGVPLAYTPYFSHPDGSVEQKSGFLSPELGFDSTLGVKAGSSYYWALAPDRDVTVGITAYTKEAPLLTSQYRKRWQDASLELNGGVTYSERRDRQNGQAIVENEDFRGHVSAEALWDVNDKWRAGSNIAIASDEQYMRQYDVSNDDVLRNEVYAERFSGRDYALAKVVAFQDIRVSEDQDDQPAVLPSLAASFKTDPGNLPLIGGTLTGYTDYLGLRREGNDQDMDRGVIGTEWDRRFVSDTGLVTDTKLSVRGDVYYINDREAAAEGSGRSGHETKARVYPQAHIQSSYPLAKTFESSDVIIEPIAAVTIAPNIGIDERLPNEDSQDAQIDASNLFKPNRFPGYDRIEDSSRVTYGIKSGWYAHDGSYGNVFLGQSYRFEDDNNPFVQGSGLDRRSSDVVGQLSGAYQDLLDVDYRFQLGSDTLKSQRHEIDTALDFGRLNINTDYLYAKGLAGTDITEGREQIRSDLGYYWAPEWKTRLGGVQDLGEDPGMRTAYLGLDYFGNCLSWTLTGERSFTREDSGESDVEILFTIGLKNLGEFKTSDYSETSKQASHCTMFDP